MSTDNKKSGNSAMRINRAIARTGYCSRRKADELVLGGQVKINGHVQTNPAFQVREDDCIEIAGKKLNIRPEFVYIMLNKPVHCVCTLHDPQNRQTVLDFLPAEMRNIGLFTVGRLDYFSEGLLLLTNDGELGNMLMHPSWHQPKTYLVTVRGTVTEQMLAEMRSGMILRDYGKIMPVQVQAKRLANGNTRLQMVLHQGINRQIRRICAQFDLTILKLTRVTQGTLQLGSLESGKWRKLTAEEIMALRKALALPVG